MATKIEAVQAYGPSIERGTPVSEEEYIEYMVRNSGESESEVRQHRTLDREARVHFLRFGRSVNEPGWGSYAPNINLAGKIHIGFHANGSMEDEVGSTFRGVIKNVENVGKTQDELVALWNADPAHANDLIPTP